MSERISCKYPDNAPTTGYKYGCRCFACVDATRTYARVNAKKYNDRTKPYKRKWYQDHKESIKQAGSWLKQLTFNSYGGVYCKCCGESNMDFLSLDHVFNDGKSDRELRGNGERFYKSLFKEDFPNKERYQVLCYNCNQGKRLNYGVCPHKTKISVRAY